MLLGPLRSDWIEIIHLKKHISDITTINLDMYTMSGIDDTHAVSYFLNIAIVWDISLFLLHSSSKYRFFFFTVFDAFDVFTALIGHNNTHVRSSFFATRGEANLKL